MKDIKVKNMTSRSGNPVPNQFIVTTGDSVYFQSYDTIIAIHPLGNNRKIILDENSWNYSATTGKYRNEFLGEGIAETRRKIDAGLYDMADLN